MYVLSAYSGSRSEDTRPAQVCRGAFPAAWGTPPPGPETRAAWIYRHASREQARRHERLRACADPVVANRARQRLLLIHLRRYDPWDQRA